jgi:hypothetical protein
MCSFDEEVPQRDPICVIAGGEHRLTAGTPEFLAGVPLLA